MVTREEINDAKERATKAARFTNLPPEMEADRGQLEIEALLAVEDAIQRFDPKRDVKFSTYVYSKINFAIAAGKRELSIRNRRVLKEIKENPELRNKYVPVVLTEEMLDYVKDHAPTPEEAVVKREHYTPEIIAAIRKLSPRQKQVVVMHFYEDKSLTDIANELGIKIQTVAVTKLLALNKLKETLGNAASVSN